MNNHVDVLLTALDRYFDEFNIETPAKGLAELMTVYSKVKAQQEEVDTFLGRPL